MAPEHDVLAPHPDDPGVCGVSSDVKQGLSQFLRCRCGRVEIVDVEEADLMVGATSRSPGPLHRASHRKKREISQRVPQLRATDL
jgi:hypothetical protein